MKKVELVQLQLKMIPNDSKYIACGKRKEEAARKGRRRKARGKLLHFMFFKLKISSMFVMW